MKLFSKKSKIIKNSNEYKGICPPGSLLNYLWAGGVTDLSFVLLNEYYLSCSPLADAVDRIAKEFASITPRLYDNQKKQFVESGLDILNCLENPNPYMTKNQYLFNLASIYLITGNLFVIARGMSNIQEMYYIEPQYLTINSISPSSVSNPTIRSDKTGNSKTFEFQEVNNIGFYTSTQHEVTDKAIFLRQFNPNGYDKYNDRFGVSKISSIAREIEQYNLLSRHNISLLNKGARLGGVLNVGDLSDDQIERLKAEAKNYFSGADNAGRILVCENGVNFIPSTMSNTDMDYRNLRSAVEIEVYKRFEIPLALISESSMTYNNLEVANLMLYDNAVLPLAKTIYRGLQDLIFSFKNVDSSRYSIKYDENEIGALRFRNAQIATQMKETGCFTWNEERQVQGYPRLSEGGDSVYAPSSILPFGENSYSDG